jgi:hypothetical protein
MVFNRVVEMGDLGPVPLGENLLWDDLRVSLAHGTIGGDPPVMTSFLGTTQAYAFNAAATNSLFFDAQLPHTWLAGSEIRPHIHWSPGSSTNTGVTRWGLEYTWANAVSAPGNVFPATTTLTVDQAAAGVAYSHQIASFPPIAGTGMRLSSILLCRLHRLGGHANDTFTGVAFGLSLDFHVQNDSGGSLTEFLGA